MRRHPEPQLSEDLSREMCRVAANDNAVVVGGVLLNFVQGCGSATSALDYVGVHRRDAVVGGCERLANDRGLVHGAAGEVGHSVGNLHPRGIAPLMPRV